MEEDDPLAYIVGCKKVRNFLVKAVSSETVKEKSSNYPSTIDLKREFKNTSLIKYFEDLEKYYSKKIKIVENEVIFIGLGMPILDSRRFIEFSNLIHFSEAYSSDLIFNIK